MFQFSNRVVKGETAFQTADFRFTTMKSGSKLTLSAQKTRNCKQ